MKEGQETAVVNLFRGQDVMAILATGFWKSMIFTVIALGKQESNCPRREQQEDQARYMSSFMLTFALLRNSSGLHIYKDLYGERNEAEKNKF